MSFHKKIETEYMPLCGELWLLSGDFRADEASSGMMGFYCIPGGYEPLTASPEQMAELEKFHAIVRHTIEQLSQGASVAVEVWDCTYNRCQAWEAQFPALRQMALEQCVSFQEDIVNGRKRYWFVFERLPQQFHEKIYQSVNMDIPYEDIYLTYSVLTQNVSLSPNINPISSENVVLNLCIDWDHLAFILQTASDYPMKRIINALSAACALENWAFYNYTKEK